MQKLTVPFLWTQRISISGFSVIPDYLSRLQMLSQFLLARRAMALPCLSSLSTWNHGSQGMRESKLLGIPRERKDHGCENMSLTFDYARTHFFKKLKDNWPSQRLINRSWCLAYPSFLWTPLVSPVMPPLSGQKACRWSKDEEKMSIQANPRSLASCELGHGHVDIIQSLLLSGSDCKTQEYGLTGTRSVGHLSSLQCFLACGWLSYCQI